MRRKTLKVDIARALGISRQRVHVLAKRGMPTDSAERARAWRAEQPDADSMKPDPRAHAPVPTEDAALKRRKLAAVVTILEDKAKNAGGVSLPSVQVERGIRTGLQLLRASINGSTSTMFNDFAAVLGDNGARKVLAMVEGWWAGVHDQAADALLHGLVRELPVWGRDFRGRYVKMLRGNFPDVPYPGEPRDA